MTISLFAKASKSFDVVCIRRVGGTTVSYTRAESDKHLVNKLNWAMFFTVLQCSEMEMMITVLNIFLG